MTFLLKIKRLAYSYRLKIRYDTSYTFQKWLRNSASILLPSCRIFMQYQDHLKLWKLWSRTRRGFLRLCWCQYSIVNSIRSVALHPKNGVSSLEPYQTHTLPDTPFRNLVKLSDTYCNLPLSLTSQLRKYTLLSKLNSSSTVNISHFLVS